MPRALTRNVSSHACAVICVSDGRPAVGVIMVPALVTSTLIFPSFGLDVVERALYRLLVGHVHQERCGMAVRCGYDKSIGC